MDQENIKHPILGALEFDPLAGWYSSSHSGFELAIDLIDGEPLEETLTTAAAVYSKVQGLVEPAKSFAAQTLIKDFNLFWRTFRPLTKKIFIARISLRRIIIRCDRADFEFDDGGLFSGHSIIVESEDDQSFSDAYIEG